MSSSHHLISFYCTLTNFFVFFFISFLLSFCWSSFRRTEDHPQSKMTAQLFRAHGKFCASHPWEVIVALLTLTACMLTVDRSKSPVPPSRLRNCQGWRESCEGLEAEYVAVDTILMTVIRCSAVLYSYYQFIYLNKFGSKYILSKCTLHIKGVYVLRVGVIHKFIHQSCMGALWHVIMLANA